MNTNFTGLKSHLVQILLVILLSVIAVHRLSDFVGIRFATADNIDLAVGWFFAHKPANALELGWNVALDQGRLPQALMITIDTLVSSIKSQVVYDILSIGSFVLALVLLSILLAKLISTWFLYIFLALALASFPQLWSHTPPSAYPVWTWLPWITFALSGLSILQFIESKTGQWAWFAGIFYAVSFFSLELFALVIPVCALTVILSTPNRYLLSQKQKKWIYAAIILIPLIFLVIYGGFRILNPSQYDGNRVSSIQVADIFSVFYQYSIGGFSLYYVMRGEYPIFYNDSVNNSKTSLIPKLSLPDAFLTGTWFDWVAALISAVLVCVSLWNFRPTNFLRRANIIVLIGVWIAFASLFLYGISEKYSTKVHDIWSAFQPAYLCTRYAYLGWILAISALVVLVCVNSRRNQRLEIAMLLICGFGVFSTSLVTSYFNRFVANSMLVHTAKWRVVDTALSCKSVWTGANDSQIFAPRLNSYVWWAFIRPFPAKLDLQQTEYWNQYKLSRGFYDVPNFAQAQNAFDKDTQLVMDYRIALDGTVLGIYTALQDSEGKSNEIRVLSRRDKSVQVLLNDDAGRQVNVVTWNAESDSCGNYMVNRLKGRGIVVSSISMWSPPAQTLNNPLPPAVPD